MNSNATKMPKSHEIERKWYVVDAEGKVLGRLATEVANILRGKNKPYSGHPGGLKEVTYRKFLADKPELLVTKAVKGMVPHNKLGSQIMTKLKVYAGNEHPHAAQQPEALEI